MLFQYLYAFNVIPLSSMDPTELISQPDDVTECPYKQKQFLIREEEEKKARDTKILGVGIILWNWGYSECIRVNP